MAPRPRILLLMLAASTFLPSPHATAATYCAYEIQFTRWLVCAEVGGVISSCYRTTTTAITGVQCDTVVLPPLYVGQQVGGGGGGGGIGGGGPSFDQDGDGKVDCWSNITMASLGASITSPFGPRIHPVTGAQHNHNGIDIGINTGVGVLAAQSGTVVEIEDSFAENQGSGNGNFVRINYDDGTQGVYLHLKSAVVAVGDTVTLGQGIGISNNTGASNSPHLHYSIWKTHNHTGSASNLSNFHDPEQVHDCSTP